MDGVGRSYFDIPTGQSQLFSENSSQLLAKSRGRSPVQHHLSSHLFQKVTYPAGHHTGAVFFADPGGTNVRAWSPHVASDKLLNFILCADLGTSQRIEIAVQLNFPAGAYDTLGASGRA